MFADECQFTVEISIGTATCRKLSHRALRKASDMHTAEQMKNVREMGGDVFKALQTAEDTRSTQDPAKARRRRFAGYDRDAVLAAGVVTWTAPRKLADGLPELDEADARALFEAIMDRSLPPTDPEAEEGKDSGASTSS